MRMFEFCLHRFWQYGFWFRVFGYGEFGQKVLQGNNRNMYGDEEYATV